MEFKEYQISRQGLTLATLGLDELAQKWSAKEFLPGDYYWTEGMAEWKPLSSLAARLEERLEELRRQKREELAKVKEAEIAQAAKLRRQAATATSTPPSNLLPAAKTWLCGDCNSVCDSPRAIGDGGEDSTVGALLFFIGLFLCLVAFAMMLAGQMEPAARFLMLLVFLGGAFFSFSFGLARIITGGTIRALTRVMGQQQCPSCGSLRLRPKA